jgi:hypothetical protein
MQKKTAIITWVSHRNFGTLLQAYALQRVLHSLGYDNHVIDDRRVQEAFPRKKFSPLRILRSIGWLFPKRASFRRSNEEVLRQYDDFKDRYIVIDSEWTDKRKLSEKYDVFIAGSDQIWSPNVPFDDFYYLAFTGKSKVAYAPSMGVSAYPDDRVPAVRPLLEAFDCLSVREPQGAGILKEKFGLHAEVVSDPTMLLTRNEWEDILPPPVHEESPYALCYFLTYNRKYIEQANAYCQKHSLKMKLLVVSPDFVGVADEDVYTGPAGFIQAVSGADVIFTDSFHGTIFSLIFEKDFHTFKRFDESSSINQNSRVEHLLASVDLADRLVDMTSEGLDAAAVDYVSIRESLLRLREKSLDYLKNSLSKV